jgi:hypothetical protein
MIINILNFKGNQRDLTILISLNSKGTIFSGKACAAASILLHSGS